MDLGKNILQKCKEKGMTISKLAKLSGVKQPTLHGWTTGRSVHNIEDLKKVCAVLQVGLYELIFGSSDPFEKKTPIFEKTLSGQIRITISHITKEESHE
jgi:transcriptional regulator with XRE-family HTH domain